MLGKHRTSTDPFKHNPFIGRMLDLLLSPTNFETKLIDATT